MKEILHLINEMSPYLLLGFLIAGLMHAFVPGKYYTKYLSGNNLRSVINAALLGIPLPLCSCGVIPTAISLRKEGASRGAVISFLIATPQTGVDSIAATYSLMGLPFALTRPIVALITAIFGGQLVNKTVNASDEELSTEDEHEEEDYHCCHHDHDEDTCTHHHDHNSEEHCHCHHAEVNSDMGVLAKLRIALQYAFVDMVEDIGKWLVVGLVVAALITILVPDKFFAIFAGNTWLSILLVLAISIPMYICATGSIPIAVAMMIKGLTPGAALVMLMAGPAANMASILIIHHQLGMKTLIAYLSAIIGGAILFGIGIDYLLPREWFTSGLTHMEHASDTGSYFEWGCTVLLTCLLINALAVKKHSHHCHHEE